MALPNSVKVVGWACYLAANRRFIPIPVFSIVHAYILPRGEIKERPVVITGNCDISGAALTLSRVSARALAASGHELLKTKQGDCEMYGKNSSANDFHLRPGVNFNSN